MSGFPFELDLALILENMDHESLISLVDRYLHKPANQLKIELLHAILEALLYQKTLTFWDVLWTDPQYWCRITGTAVVLSLGDEKSIRIGQYKDKHVVVTTVGKQL